MMAEMEWPEPAIRARNTLIELAAVGGQRGGIGREDIRVALAPGRVNLLGGHTDYNDGYVLPVAVNRFVACAFVDAPGTGDMSADGELVFYSLDFNDSFTLRLPELDRIRSDRESFSRLVGSETTRWRRYASGVVLEMDEAGINLPAGTIAVTGNVPLGSGLSSSAALEAALFTALAPGESATPEAAEICQRAENRWAGVPCGIMDQFASFMAEEGKALFLDCRDLLFRNIRLPAQTAITVVDSCVRRELADSEYRRRRQEVETALETLSKVAGPIDSLRDLSPEQFLEVEDILPEPLRSRVEHVVGAIERVPRGVIHLALEEAGKFGELMVECHRSLADLYGVSIPELDTIVERSMEVDGVLGSRLTGAGFGGCCVVLHRQGCEKELKDMVGQAFKAEFGSEPVFHHLHSAAGARLLDERDQ